ncbi:hypothetical protein B9Z55_011438 [Caenorhabditis nigoni]|uniref:Uncharacterized protein n=1 Tax=Caenorhabditis nigoni TaxID=1611254 RepID=A0A2G5UKC4_9PELO|nr:hypothetical protein B9Z55_011438 [Caenorhabditis nigoni]
MARYEDAVIDHDDFSDDDDEDFQEEEAELFDRHRTTITNRRFGIVIPHIALGSLGIMASNFFLILVRFHIYGWLNYGSLLGEAKSPGPIFVILVYSFILSCFVGFGWIFNETIIKHKWKTDEEEMEEEVA